MRSPVPAWDLGRMGAAAVVASRAAFAAPAVEIVPTRFHPKARPHSMAEPAEELAVIETVRNLNHLTAAANCPAMVVAPGLSAAARSTSRAHRRRGLSRPEYRRPASLLRRCDCKLGSVSSVLSVVSCDLSVVICQLSACVSLSMQLTTDRGSNQFQLAKKIRDFDRGVFV